MNEIGWRKDDPDRPFGSPNIIFLGMPPLAPFFPHDLDINISGARAIELAEKDTLPGSQNQTAFTDDKVYRRPHQTGLDMCIRISLGMPVLREIGRGDV